MNAIAGLIVRYAVFYAVPVFIMLLPLTPAAPYIPSLFMAPLLKYFVYPLMFALPVSLAGAVLKIRGHRALGQLVRKLFYYPFILYFFLSGILFYIGYGYFFWPAMMVIISLLSLSYSADVGPRPASAVRWISGGVFFFSLYLAFLVIYPALSEFFFWASILSAALAAATSFRAFNSAVLSDAGAYMASAAPKIFIALFAFILGYYISLLPILAAYASYVRLFTLVLALLAVAYVGYRLYAITTRYAESMGEKIYSQHAREIKLEGAEESSSLYSAVISFLKYGNKDELLVFLSYYSALSGSSLEDTNGRLEQLKSYTKPDLELLGIRYGPGKARRIITEDAEKRKKVAEQVLAAPKQVTADKAYK